MPIPPFEITPLSPLHTPSPNKTFCFVISSYLLQGRWRTLTWMGTDHGILEHTDIPHHLSGNIDESHATEKRRPAATAGQRHTQGIAVHGGVVRAERSGRVGHILGGE